MKNKTYALNTLLVLVLAAVCLTLVLVRTFVPRFILPQADLSNLALVSLTALVLDHYLAPGAKRCWACVAGFAFLTFALLPLAACLASPLEALKLGLAGCAVFTVSAWLFGSALDRLSSGPAAKAAPAVSALGLYLAAQCLMGLF